MSRESEVATYLRADVPLMAILLGGIYEDGVIGVDGIRRGTGSPTADAFDESGFLRPCALVRQRGEVPFGGLSDQKSKHASTSQVVEVYFYEDRGHTAIDLARQRTYELLQSHRLTATWGLIWALETPPVPDAGPIKNSTALRQDWQVVSIKKPSS